ncbi:hypothetical protein SDC9_164499 [bioreactor metagenome]|uniref:Uncharacterized protein n=1 Tax=bioreactor metagenome TaxID=1076179 RepID=A0A645FUG5_9ZZZZ
MRHRPHDAKIHGPGDSFADDGYTPLLIRNQNDLIPPGSYPAGFLRPLCAEIAFPIDPSYELIDYNFEY